LRWLGKTSLLIWQDQPLSASKFVSGRWEYFNNGGSLIIPAINLSVVGGTIEV